MAVKNLWLFRTLPRTGFKVVDELRIHFRRCNQVEAKPASVNLRRAGNLSEFPSAKQLDASDAALYQAKPRELQSSPPEINEPT
jgi:hypothetical protein